MTMNLQHEPFVRLTPFSTPLTYRSGSGHVLPDRPGAISARKGGTVNHAFGSPQHFANRIGAVGPGKTVQQDEPAFRAQLVQRSGAAGAAPAGGASEKASTARLLCAVTSNPG
jgi:hypothetical protein